MLKERALEVKDIPAILALQSAIHKKMARHDFLVETEEEQLAYALTGGGCAHGLFEGETLKGVWLLYFPFHRPDNLAPLLGENRDSAAHFELALLDADCRGQGLHRAMTEKMTELARADGRFTHLIATVHPENTPSLRGFLRAGFEKRDTRELYGGVTRCLLVKTLHKNSMD